jgi:N-acetyl-1-D-myo-inositol-2-amino-2-deoxy-alpha-D-glucopyranoside deacetylase
VDGEYPPSVVADRWVTHAVQDPEALAVQREALSQHVTQVTVRGDVYALSNDIAARLPGREGFARLDPATGSVAEAEAEAEAADPADPAGAGRRAGRVEGLLDGSS